MANLGPRLRDRNKLTDRELEVLKLVRVGLTNEEIAERLGISANGVKYHVSEAISKLGVSSRDEAAAVALADGGRRSGLMRLFAPLTLAKGAGAVLVAAAVAGLGVLAWGVIEGGGDDNGGPGGVGDDPAGCRQDLDNGDKGDGIAVFVADGVVCWTEVPEAAAYNVSVTAEGFDCAAWLGGGTWRTVALDDELPAGTTSVEVPTDGIEPRSIQAAVNAIDSGGDTIAGGEIAMARGFDYNERCGEPATATPDAVFPAGFIDFARDMDAAMQAQDDGFFADSTAYEPWDCGGLPFPAGGQGCVRAAEGEGVEAVLGGAMGSEGAVYDPESYSVFIQSWLTGFDEDAFDEYGGSSPRVAAVADLQPEIERQDAGDEVYTVVATRIAPESGPNLPARQALLVFVGQTPQGWRITGFTQAFPSYVDPDREWEGFPDVTETIVEWRAWTDVPQ